MVHDSDMPRIKGNRGTPRQRPPAPEGFYRVDQIATLVRANDETVRGWIREGLLAAERHTWRGKPYYLVTQAELDRMLMAGDRPFAAAGALVGAGERGSASAYALGSLGGGLVAVAGVHDHAHLLMLGLILVGFLAALGVFWVLSGRLDRP
jgi:hypothetical protein